MALTLWQLTHGEVTPRLKLCKLVLGEGTWAQCQDVILVYAMQQIDGGSCEPAPATAPQYCLRSLRLC